MEVLRIGNCGRVETPDRERHEGVPAPVRTDWDSTDWVALTGFRLSGLPQHRTCGFPHTAHGEGRFTRKLLMASGTRVGIGDGWKVLHASMDWMR